MKRTILKNLFGTPKSKVLLVAVLLVVFSAGAYALVKNDSSNLSTTDSTKDDEDNISSTEATGTSPNLDPPTNQEKKETDAHKDEIVKEQSKPNDQGSTNNSATAVIGRATVDEASGYIIGIREEGGTCTFTFSKNGQASVTAGSMGIKDAQTTICPPVDPPAQVAGSGWTVVLTYTSVAISTIKSQSQEVST